MLDGQYSKQISNENSRYNQNFINNINEKCVGIKNKHFKINEYPKLNHNRYSQNNTTEIKGIGNIVSREENITPHAIPKTNTNADAYNFNFSDRQIPYSQFPIPNSQFPISRSHRVE